MATYDCDDFRVFFGRGDGVAYSVIAIAADGRQVQTTFTLPMTSARLEEAVVSLGRSRSRHVAPVIEPEVRANAEQLGGALAGALFDDILDPFFEQARRAAAGSGRGLRLTLSLASTPELLSVPWELLYRRPTFLASQRRTPVVRYLEVGDLPLPLHVDGPVRILGVVASPTGLPVLDVAGERARVESALAGMIERGLVTLEWCDPATPRSLRERLRDGSFQVLHYVGHSDFTAEGDGLLFLANETGGQAQVTEAVLTNLLGDQTSLRLAILNSCEGARSTLTDPFAGIATSLVALGVPAVIAMQFAISDRAAIVFAEELFTSLIGRQYPVDAAVSEARKAVFTEVNEIEWATPVLFLRSEDGQLFDFATAPTALPLAVAPTRIDDDVPTGSTTGGQDVIQQTPLVPPPTDRRRRNRVSVVAAVLVAVSAIVVGAFVWKGRADDNGQQVAAESKNPFVESEGPAPSTTASPVATTASIARAATTTTESPATTITSALPSTTAVGAAPNPVPTIASVSASATRPSGTDGCTPPNPTSYEAALAVDGIKETAWMAPRDGVGATLTIALTGSSIVSRVGLIPGYDKVDPCTHIDRFYALRQVTAVRWTFDDGTFVDQFVVEPDREMKVLELTTPVTTGTVTLTILSTIEPVNFTINHTPVSEVIVQ